MKWILIFALMFMSACCQNNNFKQLPIPPNTNESSVKLVCLGGHAYWMSVWLSRAYMVPQLNDDGTPTKCIVPK